MDTTLYEWFNNYKLICLLFFIVLSYGFLVVDPLVMHYGINGYDDSLKNMSIENIIITMFFAPIFEELIFRWYLSGYRKHFLFILIQILFFSILNYQWAIWIIIFSVIIILMFIRENNRRGDNVLISNRLLYISALFSSFLFAFSHLREIQVESLGDSLLISFVAFFPGAIFLTYIRYKNGIVAAIITHVALNISILLLNTIIY